MDGSNRNGFDCKRVATQPLFFLSDSDDVLHSYCRTTRRKLEAGRKERKPVDMQIGSIGES
jgi:hypothetical protein